MPKSKRPIPPIPTDAFAALSVEIPPFQTLYITTADGEKLMSRDFGMTWNKLPDSHIAAWHSPRAWGRRRA